MKVQLNKSTRNEYITKLVLMGIFISGFVIVILTVPGVIQGHPALNLSTLDVVLLILATLRLGRMVAYDRVAEPLRRPFAQTVPDETGAGESVEPRGEGFQQAIGQLITCPICSGTWIAAILVYGLYAFPSPARIFITIFAAIGGAEMLNGALEALCWSGQLSRTLTGEKNIARQAAERQENLQRNGDDMPQDERFGTPPYAWKSDCEQEPAGQNTER